MDLAFLKPYFHGATNLTGANLQGVDTLFTASSLAGETGLQGWTVQPPRCKVAVRNGNEVILYVPMDGTVFKFR